MQEAEHRGRITDLVERLMGRHPAPRFDSSRTARLPWMGARSTPDLTPRT
jgi:hypothetical protein